MARISVGIPAGEYPVHNLSEMGMDREKNEPTHKWGLLVVLPDGSQWLWAVTREGVVKVGNPDRMFGQFRQGGINGKDIPSLVGYCGTAAWNRHYAAATAAAAGETAAAVKGKGKGRK
jgi:hypothetical protein